MTQRTMTGGDAPPPPPDDPWLPAATFRYAVPEDRMFFSDGIFGVLGFGVGEVVPTPALLASHQDPKDAGRWSQSFASVITTGETVSLWHRIVTTRSRTRSVVTSMEPIRDHDRVIGIAGVMTDLTDRLRSEYATELSEAVERSALTRGIIERAKGVLMGALDIDERRAFDTLRWHSSITNLKLREICQKLTDRLTEPAIASLPPRQRVTAVLHSLDDRPAAPRTMPSHLDTTVSEPPEPEEPAGGAGSRIPPLQLPATLIRAVAAAGVSISIADCSQPDSPLVYVNPAFEQLTGYTQAETLGRNCRFLQGDRRDPEQAAAIRTALANGEELRTTLLNVRKDGTTFFNELHLSAVRSADGRLTHYIGYQSDVSERVERENHLERLAFRDAPTGLPNRAAALRHVADLMTPGRVGGVTATGGTVPPATFGVFVLRPDGKGDSGVTDAAFDDLRALDTHPDERSETRWALGLARALRSGLPEPTFVAALRDGGFVLVTPDPHDQVATAVRAAVEQVAPPGRSVLRFILGRAGHPGAATGPEDLLDAAHAAGEHLHPR